MSPDEEANLVQTLAHESLHIYLDNQIGFLNYFVSDILYGNLHDEPSVGWIGNEAGYIRNNYLYGQPHTISPIPIK